MILDVLAPTVAISSVMLISIKLGFGLGKRRRQAELERKLADAESKFNALVGMSNGAVAPRPGSKFLLDPGDTLEFIVVADSSVTIMSSQQTTLTVM